MADVSLRLHKKLKAVAAIGFVGLMTYFATGSVRLRPAKPADQYREWSLFGGGPENIHYSHLKQINRGNVQKLKVAWSYDSGDAFEGSEMQCNPIIIRGVLYATTPSLRVVALDAASGKLRWGFDPNDGKKPPGKMRNRGVTYWESGDDRRIYLGFRNWLYSLDANT